MRENFNVRKAMTRIADGEVIKMVSTDFKTHLFKKNNRKGGKPVLHEIHRQLGRPVHMEMDYDDFKTKFGNNEFFVCEEMI